MTVNALNPDAWIAVVLLAFAAPVFSQSSPAVQRAQLFENQSKLNVTITLDRHDYLPGELAELTVTITNPTSQTLDIPRPFVSETGAFVLLEKDRRSSEGVTPGYSPALLEPDRILRPPDYMPPPLPSVRITAGQVIAQTFRSWSSTEGYWGRLVYGGSVPTWAGEFRLEYWGGWAEFRVMSPSFEAMTRIPLPEFGNVPDGPNGESRPRQLRTFAFALEAEGRHYVCLFTRGLAFDPDPIELFRPGPIRDKGLSGLRPYLRIAESETAVTSIVAESDENGNITVRWEPGTQASRRMHDEQWRLWRPETSGEKK